jgi:hypothetical protein
MNFQRLETKHYIMIMIGFLALSLLMNCDDGAEPFNVVSTFPHLPPKHWKSRNRTKWSPRWYYENEYHPAVPMVTQYDSSDYRLPYGKTVDDIIGQSDMLSEEMEELDTLDQEDIPELTLNREQMIVKKELNFRKVITSIVLASILYYYYTKQRMF